MKNLFICLFMTAFAAINANAKADFDATIDPVIKCSPGVPNDSAIQCVTIRCDISVGPFTTNLGSVTVCCGHVRINGGQTTIGCYVQNRPGTTNEPNTVTVTVQELLSKVKENTTFIKAGSKLSLKNSSIETIEGEKYAFRTGEYQVFDDKGAPSVNLVLVAVK